MAPSAQIYKKTTKAETGSFLLTNPPPLPTDLTPPTP